MYMQKNNNISSNLRTKYLVKCKVYTNVGGLRLLYNGFPPLREIIHSLQLVDYLHVQADKPWYHFYKVPGQCVQIRPFLLLCRAKG